MSPDIPRIPGGSVVITPTQMYDEFRAVRDEVKHLSSIIDPALADVRNDVAEVKAEVAVQREKWHGLDRRVYAIGIAAAALGAVGGNVWQNLAGG